MKFNLVPLCFLSFSFSITLFSCGQISDSTAILKDDGVIELSEADSFELVFDSLKLYFLKVEDSIVHDKSNFLKAQLFFSKSPELISINKDMYKYTGKDLSILYTGTYEDVRMKLERKDIYSFILTAYQGYLKQLKLLEYIGDYKTDPKVFSSEVFEKAMEKKFKNQKSTKE